MHQSWYLVITILFGLLCRASAEVGPASDDQARQIGLAVINDLINRPDVMQYHSEHFSGIHYAEAVTAYHALAFARRAGREDLIAAIRQRYAAVTPIDILLEAHHVDASVWGVVPLQQFLLSGDEKARQQGLRLADGQWNAPLENGMSSQTRYWIDDIYMINALQVMAYKVTGEQRYLDRAAWQTLNYLETLQRDNGLFYHGPEAPIFWGRGNGWVAAGVAVLLTALPKEHTSYRKISQHFIRMMAALLAWQNQDGLWLQIIDDPDAWPETSSTAMFGYAMSVGVKHGILPANRYQPVYQKAWQGLQAYLDEQGRLMQICVGTGQSKNPRYYLERPVHTGDLHGQAPLLWFAAELLTQAQVQETGE